MNGSDSPLWTIDELSAQVALALSVDYAGPGNGRVRGVPDLRTIRYYATLGLIDRPAAMRGRTALYGRRHLMQLVAIKRLQAKGATLADLQTRLVGLTDAELAQLAMIPEGTGSAAQPARRSESFWNERPAPLVQRPMAVPAPELGIQGVRLDGGVTILLSPARPMEADDLKAIRGAAAPLLKVLERRCLLANRQEPSPEATS